MLKYLLLFLFLYNSHFIMLNYVKSFVLRARTIFLNLKNYTLVLFLYFHVIIHIHVRCRILFCVPQQHFCSKNIIHIVLVHLAPYFKWIFRNQWFFLILFNIIICFCFNIFLLFYGKIRVICSYVLLVIISWFIYSYLDPRIFLDNSPSVVSLEISESVSTASVVKTINVFIPPPENKK